MVRTVIQRLDLAGGGTQTVLLDLGQETTFIAWGVITKVDPLGAVNGNDYAALDITEVDGVPTPVVEDLPGVEGRHVGAISSSDIGRPGKNITCRLRSNLFGGGQNLGCAAEFIALADL